MHVLLLGGTRFIGPRVVASLLAAGSDVTVFHRGKTPGDLPAEVSHLHGDRRDLAAHRDAFARLAPDVVVDMVAWNERDARGLVETFRGLARRVVLVSSADVYRAYGRLIGTEEGPPDPTPLTEDAPLRTKLHPYREHASGPDDPRYDYDKIPAERVVLGDAELAGTVVRLPMVYGPDDGQHRLAPYLRRMDDDRPAIVLDPDLAAWRDSRGYVEDVGAGIARAALDERAAGRIYNVADAVASTEAAWIREIGRAAGWTGEVVTAPAGRLEVPLDATQHLDLDTTRIREELGFEEIVDRAEGLRRTVGWERETLPDETPGLGLLDYDAEDALLRELGGGSVA